MNGMCDGGDDDDDGDSDSDSGNGCDGGSGDGGDGDCRRQHVVEGLDLDMHARGSLERAQMIHSARLQRCPVEGGCLQSVLRAP